MNRATRTDFDTELQRHNDVLRRACAIQIRDHVLDIGCGTGQTTREAARAAEAGSALGVDVSAPAIGCARDLARAAKIGNVSFQHGDAQTYHLPQDHFDLAISRFGTMFFANPAAAFSNIGRALRPNGRLVMMVWQARERNEWIVALLRSLAAAEVPATDAAKELNPFSLADPQSVTEILEDAGFADIAFKDVCEPVHYGVDVAAALEWIRGFTCTSAALDRLDPAAAERIVSRLRAMLAAHSGEDGVWFDSRAWLVTARRR